MSVDEKILERVKKLLALAGENGLRNDNENEAKAAYRKAVMLMEEHGLAISDINKNGSVSNIDRTFIRQGLEKYRIWANPLSAVLAKCFDCRVVLVGDSQAFIGTKSDIELMTWYYNFLKIKIARMASDKFTKQADQKAYGVGCMLALKTRLEQMFIKVQEEVRTDTTKALVVVKKAEVDKATSNFYPKLRQQRARSFSEKSNHAFYRGLEDGKKIGIGRPITQ